MEEEMEASDATPPVTVDRALSVENFLLQELQICSNAITQIRSDNTGIFNIYLVLIGLMLTGVIPTYIFRTVVGVGSLGFAGATYLICSYLFISLAGIFNFAFSFLIAICVAVLSFSLQRQQYLNIVKKLKKEYSRRSL